jgi:hypothetical protein
MVSREKASEIAEASMPGTLDFERIHELQQGWYFPIRPPQEPMFGGDCGLIVNKQTGEVFRVPGSIFGVERDLDLYDKGYQFDAYDLVVLEVKNWNDTLDVLVDLRISVTEPEYESGTVWRVARPNTACSRRACVGPEAPRLMPHRYSRSTPIRLSTFFALVSQYLATVRYWSSAYGANVLSSDSKAHAVTGLVREPCRIIPAAQIES